MKLKNNHRHILRALRTNSLFRYIEMTSVTKRTEMFQKIKCDVGLKNHPDIFLKMFKTS